VSDLRILWVKIGGLWPLDRGGRLRSFHLISELSRRHRMTVLTTHSGDSDPHGLATALPACQRITSLPHDMPKKESTAFARALVRSWFSPLPVDLWKAQAAALRAETDCLMKAGQVDLCVSDFLASAPNVPWGGPVPVLLFAHNVEHVIWKRLAETERRAWRRALLALEWRKMRRWEAATCARASLTVAVSEPDRALLAALAPGARVAASSTGVDTSYFRGNGIPEVPTRLVFTGSMDWYPNEDAMLHFVERILPLVRREIPQVRTTVVGRNPSERLRSVAAAAGIQVTGTVDDVRPYVARAAIYIVPLRVGGGTRLKIFEALAMGKAVVATSVGAEGLPLRPDHEFVQADDPPEFATAVVSLLRNPERRRAIATQGRRLVEERYSWRQIAQQFEGWCEEVVRCG
jgi:polysaccharide biosynthesis protein PslH